MRILCWELRRYWRPTTIIVCCVLTAFFCVFVRQSAASFGQYYRGYDYSTAKAYYERFGTTLDANERAQIEQDYETLREEYDALYDRCLGEYDIHSDADHTLLESAALFDQDIDGNDDYAVEQYNKAAARWGADNLAALYGQCGEILRQQEEYDNLRYQMASVNRFLKHFSLLDELREEYETTGTVHMTLEGSNIESDEKSIARLIEDVKKDEPSLISTLAVADTFRDTYQAEWTLLLLILCAFVTTPFLVSNRVRNVQPMQFAGKQGRGILQKQLGAALMAAVLVNVAADFVFYRVYFCGVCDTRFLLNCPINAGALGEMFCFDLTYRQFVLLCFAGTLLVSLLLTVAVFTVTYFCQNYIIAAAGSVVLTAVCYVWLGRLLQYGHLFHYYRLPFAVVALLPTAVILAALGFMLTKAHREDYV